MEEATFGLQELADFLQLGLATVKHKSSQQPGELPPAILLGSGRRKKRIWLKSSVVAWLLSRQAQSAGIAIAAAANAPRHGRGRPRKTGGAK
jgi:hypothetical protein